MTEYADLPSPTPKEEKELQEDEASTSKPQLSKINQLLRQVYDLELLDREVKTCHTPTTTTKILFFFTSFLRGT